MLTAPNNTARLYKADAAKWLPPSALANLQANGQVSYRFRFSRPERQAYHRRRRVKPSEWAPKHRYVTDGDFSGQPMSLKVAPYTAGIMDAAVLPFIRQVTICAVPQSSKTFTINTILAWLTEFHPGPILGAYPKETTGKANMVDKIQAMFKASPQLRAKLTHRRQDMTDSLLRLATMVWRIGWSGSAVSIADWASRYIDAQEVDKYDDAANKKETGTIELLKHRARFYPNNHKFFFTSTPTTESGNIWRIITQETSAVFVYWVRCPHCTEEQLMEFSRHRFWWPHNDADHSIDRKEILDHRLARYNCEHCGAQWTDHHRNIAIQHGTWRLRLTDKDGNTQKDEHGHAIKGEELFRYLRLHRPSSIGFMVPSWVSYMVSLSEIAHDFLRARDKNLSPEERFEAYKDFQNKHRGLPWKIEIEKKPLSHILRHRDDRPDGMVPGDNQVSSLIFGVDTQDNEFYYLILAVGWGFVNDQWIVRAGRVDSFHALARVLWEDEYRDAAGNRYVVEFGLQDMMGHRSKEVLDFCLEHDGLILPSIGVDAMNQPYTFTQKEYFPGTDKPITVGGIRAVRVNTKFFKDNMAIKFGTTPGDPGSIRLHKDIGDDFAGHMLAEQRNVKGIWEQIGSRANHWWDCLGLANCAAEYLGIKHRPDPAAIEIDEKKDRPRPVDNKKKPRRW